MDESKRLGTGDSHQAIGTRATPGMRGLLSSTGARPGLLSTRATPGGHWQRPGMRGRQLRSACAAPMALSCAACALHARSTRRGRSRDVAICTSLHCSCLQLSAHAHAHCNMQQLRSCRYESSLLASGARRGNFCDFFASPPPAPNFSKARAPHHPLAPGLSLGRRAGWRMAAARTRR